MSIDGPVKLNVQITRGGAPAIGPGKALLLEAVAETGSISAAGRRLGMSYRRAWLLVDALGRDWREPVVEASPGGGTGGGTRLTPFGRALLDRYRAMEAAMMRAGDGADRAWLVDALRGAD